MPNLTGQSRAALTPSASIKRLLPWLVAVAFFMETLDTTILNTAVPVMSEALGVAPLSMKSVLASYTLSLAVFIPISGWMADRFGTRRVFARRRSASSPSDRFSVAYRATSICWSPAACFRAAAAQ